MAGKKKIGLDFFYLYTDAFQDLKVRKLIKRKGASAFTVYIAVLCEIYRHDGYFVKMDEELPFFICEITGAEEEFCLDAIKTCLNIGLFDTKMFNRYRILTSTRIQEHYEMVNRQAKRTSTIDKYRLISSEKKAISSEEKNITSEDIGISSKKNGKHDLKKSKSKVKEISSPPISPSPLTRRGGMKEEGSIQLPKQEIWNQSLSGHTYFNLYGAMKGKIGENDTKVEEDTIWECYRLTNNARVDSYGVQMIKSWLEYTPEQKRIHPFYMVLQALQKMEKEGTIRCDMTHKEYFMYRWLKLNLNMNDCREVSAMCQQNRKLHTICQDCIKEIATKGDAIKYPGKFIIARLKEPTQPR